MVWNIFFFSRNIGNFITPTDELIFFRKVAQAPTSFKFHLSSVQNPCWLMISLGHYTTFYILGISGDCNSPRTGNPELSQPVFHGMIIDRGILNTGVKPPMAQVPTEAQVQNMSAASLEEARLLQLFSKVKTHQQMMFLTFQTSDFSPLSMIFVYSSMDWFCWETLQKQPQFFMGKSMVSCRCSLQPILWRVVRCCFHHRFQVTFRLNLGRSSYVVKLLSNPGDVPKSLLVRWSKWLS